MKLLSFQNVSKKFGSNLVTDNVSFEINQGEIVGVVGPNGAGKSTMFNLIGGDLQPNQGEIFFKEKPMSRIASHDRCHLGIARTYQIPLPFTHLTVLENVMVAATFGDLRRSHPQKLSFEETVLRALELSELKVKSNLLAGSLTLLQRKRLELARALATTPDLLLLDEIAGGLTENESRVLVEVIQKIHSQGVTIVWVEHVLHALLATVKRILALDLGKLIADGDPKAVMESDEVKKIYLGVN